MHAGRDAGQDAARNTAIAIMTSSAKDAKADSLVRSVSSVGDQGRNG